MAEKALEDEKDRLTGNMELSNAVKNLKINNDTMDHNQNIPIWLRNCESPFHWHHQMPTSFLSELLIETCLERLDEIRFDEEDFSLYRYSLLLNLVLAYSILKNEERVKETLEAIKNDIQKNSADKDPQYERFEIMLAHVISTTEAYVLASKALEEQSKKIAQGVVAIDQMDTSNKAGLLAIKGSFFYNAKYDDAVEVAVQMLREAVALQPDHHEWLFLLSLFLRQQRKEIPFNASVPREELVLLEHAFQKCRSSKYLLYLAQVNREFAAQAHKQHFKEPFYSSSELCKSVDYMQRKALSCYEEALELNQNHAGNLRRIGYGIMHLPKHLADYDLALKCLLKSLDICNSSYTLHVLGTFYLRYGKDNKKALEYFIKSNSFHGLCDSIRVKYYCDPNYNPCEDIEKGLHREIKTKNRISLLTELCGYFLFVKRNFIKSLDSFNKAIYEDKDSMTIRVFKSSFLRMSKTINLYHFMANEAFLYIQQNKSTSEEEDKDGNINQVMALINTIKNIHPELAKIDPDPYLIEKLCTSSKIHREQQLEDVSHRDEHRRNIQGHWRGGFQQRERTKSSGGGGLSDTHVSNWRERPLSENWRNNDQTRSSAEDTSARFAGSVRGRGQNPNRGHQNGFHMSSKTWR